ncbi:MAG: DEAD/DEAH box helicase [Pirellulales bacterium]|nr:DEAD/DEAH box helicase [Pirellulales bacterium]
MKGRSPSLPTIGWSWSGTHALPIASMTCLEPAGAGCFLRSMNGSDLGAAALSPDAQTVMSRRILAKLPDVVSLSLASWRRGQEQTAASIKIFSARFAPGIDSFAPRADEATLRRPTIDRSAQPQRPARHVARHRIAPPGDVVKLEDRLYYLLQPPLEAWMAGQAIELPQQPFPYQYEGIAFLYPRMAAILADEMGLGKTMQAIVALRLLLRAGEIGTVLVVCPKPLVTNWQRELGHWAPEIPSLVIEGDQPRRQWQWRLPDCPIKIANYELLLRDRELLAEPGLHFDLVLLDESQRIKNRASATAELVRALPRRRSWALTGTPIENRADDLVGIFEFLSPGYLSSDMKPGRMGRLAGDYILRRTKEKVLADLPPRLVRDVALELTPAQRESYRLAEEEGVIRLTSLGEAATIQHVFELILRLKQICNFDPLSGDSVKLEYLEADLEEIVASGQKAIVFSQYVTSLEELRSRLARYAPLVFHGRVSAAQRENVLQRFREDHQAHLLLLSYGAGGVGLNLQFASYVFLFDRWWNPAVEDQAINRAHRIGAKAAVTVTRFLAVGTIEERINRVLEEKRSIFDMVLSGAEASAPLDLGLSREEIFGLFRLRCPTGSAGTQAA